MLAKKREKMPFSFSSFRCDVKWRAEKNVLFTGVTLVTIVKITHILSIDYCSKIFCTSIKLHFVFSIDKKKPMNYNL